MSLNELSAVLLLLLTQLCRGQYRVIVPSQPIIAAVGSDVVLPCQLDPPRDLGNLNVEWSRPDRQYVLVTRNGNWRLIDQNSVYLGRTTVSDRKLKYGDMSLELSRVRPSDDGTYHCYVPQMDKGANVTLLVVSVSTPSIHLTKNCSGSPVLKCESGGWYPEPELVWLDSEGNVLSEGWTEALRGTDDLFTVRSRLTVEQSHGINFTCRVSQNKTNKTRETHITISDEFLAVPFCSVTAWTLFSLGLCLLIAAAVLFVVWKFKFNQTKAVTEHTELREREEGESLMETEEKEQSLDLKESGHSEDLEKIEEDLQFIEDMINKLTETKEFIMSLREKQQLAIQQLNTQIELEKENWYFVEMLVSRGKKNEEQSIQELKKQREECEKMIKNIDNQIKMTEEMILEVTKRKGKLERDKEQVTKFIKQEKKLQEAAAQPETQQLLVKDE